jgi:hypothetical protein
MDDGSRKLLRADTLEADPDAVQDLKLTRQISTTSKTSGEQLKDEPLPLWAVSETWAASAEKQQQGLLSLDDAIADELRMQEEREKRNKLYVQDIEDA